MLVLLTISSLVLFFFWLTKDAFTTENPPAVFSMSDKILYNKMLLIRRSSPNGNLLLKILDEKTIFQYDINQKSVSKVGERVWSNATEKVSICQGSSAMSEKTEVGKYNTYGKYALVMNDSPNKAKLAIISAYGPKVPTVGFIFGGGYRIFGQRYLEIKENITKYPTIAKPIRIEEMSSPSLCWSEDENLVVIYDHWNYSFSVVNLSSEPAPQIAQNADGEPESKPDLSRLTGVVRDYGVDEDGNGIFEKIVVEIETETNMPGRYTIHVGLKSDNDKYFGETVETELKGGIETTKILFDTKPLFDKKIDGVFQINYVQLYYANNPILEMRENLGQTQAYKLEQLGQRPNIIYTGENIITPIDKNRNGKYEGLQIQVGVDVLNAGNYKFQGDLYDELTDATAEGLIEFGSGEAALKKGKGTVTFFFSGKKIIEHGVSGKFRLRFMVIYKKGQTGEFKENLLTTESFDVNQFESED